MKKMMLITASFLLNAGSVKYDCFAMEARPDLQSSYEVNSCNDRDDSCNPHTEEIASKIRQNNEDKLDKKFVELFGEKTSTKEVYYKSVLQEMIEFYCDIFGIDEKDLERSILSPDFRSLIDKNLPGLIKALGFEEADVKCLTRELEKMAAIVTKAKFTEELESLLAELMPDIEFDRDEVAIYGCPELAIKLIGIYSNKSKLDEGFVNIGGIFGNPRDNCYRMFEEEIASKIRQNNEDKLDKKFAKLFNEKTSAKEVYYKYALQEMIEFCCDLFGIDEEDLESSILEGLFYSLEGSFYRDSINKTLPELIQVLGFEESDIKHLTCELEKMAVIVTKAEFTGELESLLAELRPDIEFDRNELATRHGCPELAIKLIGIYSNKSKLDEGFVNLFDHELDAKELFYKLELQGMAMYSYIGGIFGSRRDNRYRMFEEEVASKICSSSKDKLDEKFAKLFNKETSAKEVYYKQRLQRMIEFCCDLFGIDEKDLERSILSSDFRSLIDKNLPGLSKMLGFEEADVKCLTHELMKMVAIVIKAEFTKNAEEFFRECGYNVDKIKNEENKVDQSSCREIIIEMIYDSFTKSSLDEDYEDLIKSLDREVNAKEVFYKFDLQKIVYSFCRLWGIQITDAVDIFERQNREDEVNKIMSKLCAILGFGQENECHAIYKYELTIISSFLYYESCSKYNLCIESVFELLRKSLQ